MAIKKSELYSSLWASCDALRGGMDASQYKDYILVLLFVKYVSDKYAGRDELIVIPEGGSFQDMVTLKGAKEIGDKMNKIIQRLGKENNFEELARIAEFNDPDKLGKGDEMIDRLTRLISIFQRPELDFSKNRAQGDDILGDAYEYLMRKFATESGKSKGQFYTPSEVSRVMAKILQVKNPIQSTTYYDPTCGSGSLLLQVFEEADNIGSVFGQEKDSTTASLAKMNMIVHQNNYAEIEKGQSTLSHPLHVHKNTAELLTFDYVVANPPFSLKDWTTGFDPYTDYYNRFYGFGVPPEKNGDYAFLIHIIASMNSTAKGACILPHGVLFRGNAEGQIRKNIIQRKIIKGIIGLPANLFYGTGIPACIIVLDNENTETRNSIFMIDASKEFVKDGNKNRLREQDIHKIVDTFTKNIEIPKYSRFVPLTEIEDPKNDYNLNIPRYIDNQEGEDRQDIEAHLLGGIPNKDIKELQKYWDVYPTLKNEIFEVMEERPTYSKLKIEEQQIKQTIFEHQEFRDFSNQMDTLFVEWKNRTQNKLENLEIGFKPKELITAISEDILKNYYDKKLINAYDVYQHVMNYWNETLQDDSYIIAVDGWNAKLYLPKDPKTGKLAKEFVCDLIPKKLVTERYFKEEKNKIEELENQKENLSQELTELEEEHNTEDGFFDELEKINKGTVLKELKKLQKELDKIVEEEEKNELQNKITVFETYIKNTNKQTKLNSEIKAASEKLYKKVILFYPTLTQTQIKQLAIEDKWLAVLETNIKTEMQRISQKLTQRIKELAQRYDTTLPNQNKKTNQLEQKVIHHLQKMGYSFN